MLSAPEVPSPAQRVLIVEHDAQAMRQFEHILDGCAETTFARRGEDLLAAVRRRRPDLVLLDVDQPGLDACSALRAEPALADLPVIFITGRTGPEEECWALEHGAVDCLSKPLNPPVVRARVRAHLALRQRETAAPRPPRLQAQDGAGAWSPGEAALARLPDGRAFEAALAKAWRSGRRSGVPLSVLLVDVDHFRRYNAAHGHAAGDDCLLAVAAALSECAQRSGDSLARLAGGRFAVCLPGTGPLGARTVGEALRTRLHALALPHEDSPVAPHVTASVGAATLVRRCTGDRRPELARRECLVFQACCKAPRALMALAAQALESAHRDGRDRCAASVATADPALVGVVCPAPLEDGWAEAAASA